MKSFCCLNYSLNKAFAVFKNLHIPFPLDSTSIDFPFPWLVTKTSKFHFVTVCWLCVFSLVFLKLLRMLQNYKQLKSLLKRFRVNLQIWMKWQFCEASPNHVKNLENCMEARVTADGFTGQKNLVVFAV